MRKKDDVYTEIFLSTRETASQTHSMVKAGTARKIGPRLYTRNMTEPPEAVVKRNLWQIVALLAPGTVVSHRTAFENRPAPDGSIFVTGDYPRQIALPGVLVRQVQGPGAAPNDMPYVGTLHLASQARSFLENLSPSRRSERVSRTIGQKGVEQKLTDILRTGGEDRLNRLRDEARSIAPQLGMEAQFQQLDQLSAALLRSRPAPLATPVAQAYAGSVPGEPYDPGRIAIFDAAFAALRNTASPHRPDRSAEPSAFTNVAFFDAYFSNYIEGTEFPVEQAARIVFEGEIPANRPEDAHDILGTYRLVGSPEEMQRCPGSFDEFVRLLHQRHASIMEARSSALPGQFKTENNQAGATLFVAPELVIGTLRQGYSRYRALEEPFARALFMMLVVTEIHPFNDGNGRIARVMMNAELISAGQTRIFIPSVYRNEYIGSLKRLTTYAKADALMRVMGQAQLFVERIDFADFEAAKQTLARHNAFHDPSDEVKLTMPPERVSKV